MSHAVDPREARARTARRTARPSHVERALLTLALAAVIAVTLGVLG